MILKNNKVIIENALNKNDLEYIQSIHGGLDMPWSYNDGVASTNDGNFQFVVPVWTTLHFNRTAFDAASSILNIISPEFLLKIKTNLRTKTDTIQQSIMHNDSNIPGSLTAIFYLNTCDGYTIFNDGDKIHSVENTLIIFPGRLLHCGTTCTNENRRLVININYMPNPENDIWKMLMTDTDIQYKNYWNNL